MTDVFMPRAVAVWLVNNTTLTFEQIAAFCTLHPLEVQGIADGDVANNVRGMDPVASGQLTREEIERCQEEATAVLKASPSRTPQTPARRSPRYTPLSRRRDRPDAIAWILRNHPEITDARLSRLIGTTKNTIDAIRNRTHWNSINIKPVDPVTLGLCSQAELEAAIKAGADKAKKAAAASTDTPA